MKKVLAMLLALAMVFALAACGKSNEKALVVGYSPFSNKFSPFFAQTAYDQDAQGMTQLGLLTTDRTGAVITKGIVNLLIKVFSGQTPDDILAADLSFLDEIGLKEHLSPTRSNGLLAMLKQMLLYAEAYKLKEEQA